MTSVQYGECINGVLFVCSLGLPPGGVSQEHLCPFSSDSVVEVSGADGKLPLDTRCLSTLLSDSPKGEEVTGRPGRLALGRTGTPRSTWE